MFASKTFAEHVARGLIGFGAIGLAIWLGGVAGPVALIGSLLLGAGSLVALRGCPVCWTTGLFEMIAMRKKARAGLDAGRVA